MEEIVKNIIEIGFSPIMCLLIYKVNCDQLVSMRETINNNTLVIQRLIDKLGVRDDE